jgi:anthranilate phosphoribosyltransferase
MIRELLPRLVRGERLAREETAAAIRSMMQGGEDPALVGAFLMALAQRGETADELAGAAEALRAAAVPFPGEGPLLDTCGTGGDGTHTYNISTVVGFIAAAAGRRVAKHGNRSVSSRCGSADVLEALGARVDLGPEGAVRALEETGFCFLYAPRFHPSMKEVAGEAGARRNAAILNAAAALWVAGAAGSLKDGAALTREALDSGAAARVLDRYVALSRAMGAE